MLRAFKNRFGAVNELGVFAMGETGLREVPNPSAIFLSGSPEPQPGSCVMVTREGTRPLLVEAQALVDASPLANPRRVALGLEQSRLAMLLAVMHRHGGIGVYDQDVYVNIVGGIRVQETAADLPVLLAILSSFRNRPLETPTVAFGEVGLSGKSARAQRRGTPARGGDLRLQTRHRRARQRTETAGQGFEVIAVERLAQALEAAQ